MKRILATNPPTVCVNACQQEWYSFAHPNSLLKIGVYQKKPGGRTELLLVVLQDVVQRHRQPFGRKGAQDDPIRQLNLDFLLAGMPGLIHPEQQYDFFPPPATFEALA